MQKFNIHNTFSQNTNRYLVRVNPRALVAAKKEAVEDVTADAPSGVKPVLAQEDAVVFDTPVESSVEISEKVPKKAKRRKKNADKD